MSNGNNNNKTETNKCVKQSDRGIIKNIEGRNLSRAVKTKAYKATIGLAIL